MKKAGFIFLVAVWSLLLTTRANAIIADVTVSPIFVKPLNYASFFKALTKDPINALEMESQDVLVEQPAITNIGYLNENANSEANAFPISPYWFYALKIIVLLGVLMWDNPDKNNTRRRRH